MAAQTQTPKPRQAGETVPSAMAFVRDKDSEARIEELFGALGIHDSQIRRGDVDQAIELLRAQRSPRLLVVDVADADDPAAKLQHLAEFCDPSTAVVAIGDRNDIALYRNLRELGVSEYFYKPLVPELLRRACGPLFGRERASDDRHLGALVTILGVRGGVGTTTIAVNTSWHLAEALRRHVVLLDLDLQGGDAALHLDAKPSHALSEALKNPDRLDNLFVERAVTRLSDRLDLLASLEPLSDLDAAEEDAVLALFAKLQERYRYIITDLPFWAASRFQRVMRLPATLVLVADETLASARDARRWMEQIGSGDAGASVVVVLNKAHAAGSLSDAEFADALGREPDVVVPFDPRIGEAGNLGLPAIAKSTALRHGLAPLFQRVAGAAEEADGSLLRRIFGR